MLAPDASKTLPAKSLKHVLDKNATSNQDLSPSRLHFYEAGQPGWAFGDSTWGRCGHRRVQMRGGRNEGSSYRSGETLLDLDPQVQAGGEELPKNTALQSLEDSEHDTYFYLYHFSYVLYMVARARAIGLFEV